MAVGMISTQRSLPSADMPPFEDDSVEDVRSLAVIIS